jgi:hypothetical protein
MGYPLARASDDATHPFTADAEPVARLAATRARPAVVDVRRRILLAARRGATEVAIGGVDSPLCPALAAALRAEGFTITPVTGEDGAYAVVSW